MDPTTLQQLCDTREVHVGVVVALAPRVPTNTAATDTVRHIPCPQCGKLMNRVNFARSSGVVMDVCKADGVWHNRGELQRVMGFVEQGGLSAARARERQQLIDERWRLEAARNAGEPAATGFPGVTVRVTTRHSSSGAAVDQLLRDALGSFIK